MFVIVSVKTKILRTALCVLTALAVSAIFLQSFMNADDSSTESGAVLDLINRLFGLNLTDHIIRKAAHFTEFFILGLLMSATLRSFSIRPLLCGVFASLFGLTVAAVDEFIQTFSDGRSSDLFDALIDFSGAFCACLIITAFCLIRERREEN